MLDGAADADGVLVTRPEPGAAETARRTFEAGEAAETLPGIEAALPATVVVVLASPGTVVLVALPASVVSVG